MKSIVLLSILLPAAGIPAALVVGQRAATPPRSASASHARTSYRVTFGHAATRSDRRATDAAAQLASDFLPAEEGLEFATIDDDRRFEPTERPERPEPQHPPVSTPENVDTGKPVHDWQRATDDWFGLRPKLDDRGVTFQASLAAEYAKNLQGGLNTAGGDFRHLFNLNLTLNTERLFGLAGGTAFVNFQNQNGQEGLDVGDAQGYSNIDADGRTQVSELWYEQVLVDGKVRVKVGKIDANTEFAFAENAGEFINSSMGFSPTIMGLTTYPDPSFGGNVFVYPCEQFYAGAGVYDGAGQEGVLTGSHGPKTLFGDPSDLFLIGEAGATWSTSGGRNGRLGLGVWHHTGTFDRFDGEASESGTTGFYAVLDQSIWRENPNDEDDTQGLGLYAQYGYADADVSPIEHHVGLGCAWQGAVPSRDDDVLGAGVSWVRFSDENGAGFDHDSETAVEIFYKLQVTPWISIKPDLQYIYHPGGIAGQDNALVATVRAVVDF